MSASSLSNTNAPGQGHDADPSSRQMLGLWLPLAASISMMVLEPSIINIGLGRTSSPDLALAAFGVAFGLALLVEAPILMLLDASVARSRDREAFGIVRRITLILGLAVTALGLVVSLTPLYDLIVVRLMDIPLDVAAEARPTLQILSFWPLPIAWRRAHQGVLIRAEHTTTITAATGIRLATLSVSIIGGLFLFPWAGAVVAGIAMDLSVVVEALVITALLPASGRDDHSAPVHAPRAQRRHRRRSYAPRIAGCLARGLGPGHPHYRAGVEPATAYHRPGDQP